MHGGILWLGFFTERKAGCLNPFFGLFVVVFSLFFPPFWTVPLKSFRQKCFIETLELVSAPFPCLGLLELCQEDLLAVLSLLEPSTSCLVDLFHVLGGLLL